GLMSGCGNGQRVGSVALVAVEKMLTVDDGFAPDRQHRLDGLRDGLEVFLIGHAESYANVVVPSLGHQTNGPGSGLQRGGETAIVRRRAPGALGHPKGGKGGVGEAWIGAEKLRVGNVGARISPLDVIDT